MSNATKSPARIAFLTDVLIIAVEGGIGYWSQCSGYAYSPENPDERGVTLYVPTDDMDPDQVKVPFTVEEITIGGGFFPPEDIDAYVFRITLDDLARGLGIVTRGEAGCASDYVARIGQASRENDAGYMDSLDADIVVQAAAFGQTVYS